MKLAAVRRKLDRVDRTVEKAIERGETAGAVVLAQMGDNWGGRAGPNEVWLMAPFWTEAIPFFALRLVV